MPKRGSDRQVSDARVLVEFLLTSDPALFTSEVSENLPVTRQRVNELLDDLEEERGFVTSKTASGRRLWWMTIEGHEHVAEYVRKELS